MAAWLWYKQDRLDEAKDGQMIETLSAEIQVSGDVLAQEMNGESVLLDLKSESYFGLDEVGTRVWQLLCDSNSLSAIHETIVTEYDVSADQAEADIITLVSQMVESGIARVA